MTAPDLTDPVTVHANMLRGTIAKPTVEQIVHLYGVDALTKALAPVIVREAIAEAEKRGYERGFANALTGGASAPDALHRSFPEAGDGRPMPPMGDELMTAGLSAEDARFVAVQLAQNGWTLTPTPVDDSQTPDPAVKALDDLARLGQEFDAAPDPACDHCGMDPAAIREAAITECANAIWHGPIRDYGRAAQGHELTAAHNCRDTILALIQKGAAE